MAYKILVNLGEAKVIKERGILVIYSLSSCIALMLYDTKLKVAGMSHIMLPEADSNARYEDYPKFGNKAVEYLLKEMEKYGAKKYNIVAKVAGGSDVFKSGIIDIGRRNVESVKNSLKKFGIKIVGEDTGGNLLRTVFFNAANGVVIVRTHKYSIRI